MENSKVMCNLKFQPLKIINKYSFFHRSNNWLLLLILILGSILRFYHFNNLPFSHDELSAILRCEFPDFKTLIEHGVKTDFHPPGIQVFLYYWMKLVGTSEWLVKLPFALASVYSIFIIYKIGSVWKNETLGLIAASFLATSQFAILYGTIARPYSIGLLFTLLLFLSLLKLSNYRSSVRDFRFWKSWILFIISGVILTYTHHFSLLVAGLIGFIGLFLIYKPNLRYYLLAGATIILFYIPNLGILFFQLSKGGVGGADGWLAIPDNNFLRDFISYIFHYSLYSFFLVATIFVIGLLNSDWSKKYLKIISISLFLFFTPFLIGYIYSIKINPILQFSVLIFSHFYLYFILFGHFKNLSSKINALIIVLICSVNIFSLIVVRKHFELIETSYYVGIIDDLVELREKNKELPAIIDCSWSIRGFYAKKKGYEPNYQKYSELNDQNNISNYIDSVSKKHSRLFIAATSFVPQVVVAEIRSRFPELICQKNYLGGTSYLFGKRNDNRKIISSYSNGLYWSDAANRLFDKMDHGYSLSDSIEFSSSCELKLSDMTISFTDQINIQLNINSLDTDADMYIVAELYDNDELIEWTGTSSNTQQIKGSCTKLVHSFNLEQANHLKNAKLKVYLWNPKHKKLLFSDLKIYIQSGNPITYGLNLPIEN